MTAKQAAEKWNITQRQVLKLCKENRIEGADRLGFMWTIPADAEKPIDKRTIRYVKEGKVELKPFIKRSYFLKFKSLFQIVAIKF